MTESLVIIVEQLAVLTVVGWMCLSPLPRLQREVLLPAAPVFGAGLTAVTMSTTSWFWDAGRGAWLTALVALGLLAWSVWHQRHPWLVSRRALGTAALACLTAVPSLLVVLLPARIVGDNMAVMPYSNLDAYYYATESTWLHDHPVTPGPHDTMEPGTGNTSLAYGPMVASLGLSLRIGQPMVHAALDVVLGRQAVETVSPLIALWTFLVGPTAYVASRLLRARTGTALAAGVLTSTSAVLLRQAFQQNMDSLLGASLALLTVATTVAAADRRLHRWPAVVSLAGLVAVYTEYAVFVAPAVLGVLAVRRGLRTRWRTLATVGLGAVAVAPTAWVRGARTLLVDHSEGDGWVSPFFSDGRLLGASRALGLRPLWPPSPVPSGAVVNGLTLVLTALLVVGLGLAAALHRYRGVWLGMLGVGGPYIGLLTVQRHGYSQLRAVSLFLPLVVVVVVLGWGEAWTRLRRLLRSRWRPERAGVALGSAATTVTLLVASIGLVNLHTASTTIQPEYVKPRHVDRSYAEVASWVRAYGGDKGEAVTVVETNVDLQVWLAYTLRAFPLVSYPALHYISGYLRTSRYWDWQVDRYYVVGAGGFVAGDAGVVAQNERFALVHLDGPSLVATPVDPVQTPTTPPMVSAGLTVPGLSFWSSSANPDGSMTGDDCGEVLVMTHDVAAGRHVTITVGSSSDGPVAVVAGDQTLAVGTITDGVGVLRFEWGTDPYENIRIDLGANRTVDPGTITLIGVGLDP